MWRGRSPFQLAPVRSEPVLRAADIPGGDALFVADPFMLQVAGTWHMFYEVLEASTRRGVIGHAFSRDGDHWTHDAVVLREPYHLSYPHVFEADGDWWMVPEALESNAVRLYRAARFPYAWEHVADLVEARAADPTPFRWNGSWWLFACSTPERHDTLALFGAPRLTGPWTAHPATPIVSGNAGIARPGGRMLVLSGRLHRVAQNCVPAYGTSVVACELTTLTTRDYAETVPRRLVIPGARSWNCAGMHHLDAHRLASREWIACVDGRSR